MKPEDVLASPSNEIEVVESPMIDTLLRLLERAASEGDVDQCLKAAKYLVSSFQFPVVTNPRYIIRDNTDMKQEGK